MSEEHFFYGDPIYRNREQAYIQKLLQQYRHLPADETLKETIWNTLQKEKAAGNIKIPFKVVLITDPENLFPPAVEVILDTKV